MSNQITDGLVQVDQTPHMLVYGGDRVGRAGIHTKQAPSNEFEIKKRDDGVVQVFMGNKIFRKTGAEWAERMGGIEGGCALDPWAQAMLDYHSFDSGSDMSPDIVIIPCGLIPPNKRTMDKMHVVATKEYGATMMNHGAACMLRSILSPADLKDLGFSKIVCAHQPISVYAGPETPDEARDRLFTISCVGSFGFEGLPYNNPTPWGQGRGIAFASIDPFQRSNV